MKTGQQSQLQSDIAETAQTNRKSGEENVRITEIPDSPFKHVKQDNKEFIVLGNHIVHECNLMEALKLVSPSCNTVKGFNLINTSIQNVVHYNRRLDSLVSAVHITALCFIPKAVFAPALG